MGNLTYSDIQTPDGTRQLIKQSLDELAVRNPIGQLSTAMFDTMYGINHRQTPNSVPINKDYYGLTFFTKPNMNMKLDNLRTCRQFIPLLTNEQNSMGRAIRALLDHEAGTHEHDTPLVDNFQAFIPILTNQLESISGWPDVQVPYFTTKPGAYGEEVSYVDGDVRVNRAYDIRANFRNINGDPITNLFMYWIWYQSMVFQGVCVPYMKYIIQHTVDYNTRIYRLVLDESRQFVQKIAATGASFPIDTPMGNAFNFDSDGPINRANDKITITFHCNGAMYQDPILIYEFNQTVGGCNSKMVGTDEDRSRYYQKLKPVEAQIFNHRGYPYINPNTYELQWWVPKDEYAALIGNTDVTDDELAAF